MKKYFVIFLSILSYLAYGQNETYNYENYFVKIDNSILKAYNSNSSLFYQKRFSDPMTYAVDLDSDYVKEIVVIDHQLINGRKKYTLFVYNTLDSLFLADSVYSGSMEPYQVFSKELNTILLVTGNANFDSLNTIDSLSYLSSNFWKFEEGALYLANASVYDLYLSENEEMIDLIEEFYSQNGRSCNSAIMIKGIIASAFTNYYNAGEITFASQLLKNYYLCSDIGDFKKFLINAIK